jgi:hypothetical protein
MTDSTNPAATMADGLAELLPCPVCGDAPKWRGTRNDYVRGLYRLQCLGETHLVQSYGATEAIAIAAWNQRAALRPAQPAAVEVEALVERLREGQRGNDDYGEDMIRAANLLERLSAIAAERDAMRKELERIRDHDGVSYRFGWDGNDIWEALFSIMKGDVPEELTVDVLEQLAAALSPPSAPGDVLTVPDQIERVMSSKWLDPECGEGGCQSRHWKGLYEQAVGGRQDFRQALREAREEAAAALSASAAEVEALRGVLERIAALRKDYVGEKYKVAVIDSVGPALRALTSPDGGRNG